MRHHAFGKTHFCCGTEGANLTIAFFDGIHELNWQGCRDCEPVELWAVPQPGLVPSLTTIKRGAEKL